MTMRNPRLPYYPKRFVRIVVNVLPEACGDEVSGWTNGTLKVLVAAPQENGHANSAVESLLSEVLGVPREKVRVVAGRASTDKLVQIEDFDEADLDDALPGCSESDEEHPRPPLNSFRGLQ
jgi:uncharacterized protein YggU (UPF0235/DUF167 family)